MRLRKIAVCRSSERRQTLKDFSYLFNGVADFRHNEFDAEFRMPADGGERSLGRCEFPVRSS